MSEWPESKDGKFRVLLIHRGLIPSIRLCAHCQMEYLAEQGKVEYRAVYDAKLSTADMNWANMVILGRLDNWYEYQLARILRKAGKQLLYILDDDILNIPPEISSASYYGREDIQYYIRSIIQLSDGMISPSPLLLEKYVGNGKRAIQIEEPAISPMQYSPRKLGEPIRIGFAGSIDRTQDLEKILKEVLIGIKREFGDRVAIEFYGAIPSFAAEVNARCIPYNESYDDYRNTLNGFQWDIGLAPMPNTSFHACKHYNKFIEYAAAGIVGVFSDVYPYTRINAFPECYVLCENTAESWTHALRELIEDTERREAYRRRVIECARGPLSIASSAAQLEAALFEMSEKKSTLEISNAMVGFLKAYSFFNQVCTKLSRDGVSGLSKAVGKRISADMKLRDGTHRE